MAGIVVKPRARIYHGHEWVYSSEIKKVFGNPKAGDVVSLKDFKDRPLGSGIYNPHSQIVVRRFSRRQQDLDEAFFKRRLERALAYRERLAIDPTVARLVWSEADGLPGVIIDRYGDAAVLQTVTYAMDQRKALIAQVIQQVTGVTTIVERNDSSMRQAEGLEPVKGLLLGEASAPTEINVDGLAYQVDLLEGQKTGLYLDQLDNHRHVATLANGKRVLDVFSHQGAFALACKQAGAEEVTGIEISDTAVAAAKENARRNGLAIDFREGNAFDQLRELEKANAHYDLIILDPPSFTRSKSTLKDALRGYKEIHLRALRLLGPGGLLATFSCSHHLGATDYAELIASAAVDSKKTLRRVASYTQRADHPVIATLPETEYLRGSAYEVLGAW